MSKKLTNRSPVERVTASRLKYRQASRTHKEELYGLIAEACSLTYEFDDDPNLFRKFKKKSFFEKMRHQKGRKRNLADVCTAVSVYIFSSPSDKRGKVAYKHERIIDYARREGMLGSTLVSFIRNTGGIGKTFKLATMTYPRRDPDLTETTFEEIPGDSDAQEPEDAEGIDGEDMRNEDMGGSDAHEPSAKKETKTPVKPKWPKNERSLNLQARCDDEFNLATSIEPEQEIVIQAKRRAFDGEYIDLVVVSIDVLPKNEG